MPRFKVTVIDDQVRILTKTFEASDQEAAQEMAFGEDWREWTQESAYGGSTYIDYIEEVK